MKATLVVKKGSTTAQVIQLRSRNTLIGRMQGCDVRIPSQAVSRHHCKVRIKYDYLMVEDLDSANGTFVNGERIDGRKVVHPGDQLQIGPVVFVIKYQLSDTGAENMGGDETVMKPLEIETVEEADEAAEPVELEVVEDDDDAGARPVDKDTTSSSPSLEALEKAQKKKKKTTKAAPPDKSKPKGAKEPAAKKDDDKPSEKKPPEKKEREDDSTPDSSQILDGRRWDPPAGNDLRSLFSDDE